MAALQKYFPDGVGNRQYVEASPMGTTPLAQLRSLDGGGLTEQEGTTDLRGVIGEPTSGKLSKADSGLWTGFLAPKYPPATSTSWLSFGQTGVTGSPPPTRRPTSR